jgi:hypothetical protein
MPSKTHLLIAIMFAAFIVIALRTASFAQNQGPRGTPNGSTFSSDLGKAPPKSLDDFIKQSDFIVDAVVESVLPSYTVGAVPILLSDSVLKVTRVIKGSDKAQRFVVGQMGGQSDGRKDYTDRYPGTLMAPGQRYLLFLTELNPRYPSRLPARENLHRYEIQSTFAGLARISHED